MSLEISSLKETLPHKSYSHSQLRVSQLGIKLQAKVVVATIWLWRLNTKVARHSPGCKNVQRRLMGQPCKITQINPLFIHQRSSLSKFLSFSAFLSSLRIFDRTVISENGIFSFSINSSIAARSKSIKHTNTSLKSILF